MAWEKAGFRYTFVLLAFCALLLSMRLVYLFLADATRFPVNTVKIAAAYQYTTRQQLETILSDHLQAGFFGLSVHQLHAALSRLPCIKDVQISRIWPDTLKLIVIEKTPVALWKGSFVTADGQLFKHNTAKSTRLLPELTGPDNQCRDVLQMYQKLSKILSEYGLRAASLHLSDNQAWELVLVNGVKLSLGTRDLELRLRRFCKAYPALFADKSEQLSGVDLRYIRGMAVRWK